MFFVLRPNELEFPPSVLMYHENNPLSDPSRQSHFPGTVWRWLVVVCRDSTLCSLFTYLTFAEWVCSPQPIGEQRAQREGCGWYTQVV